MMRRLSLLYAWKRRCSACSDAHGASRRHFRFLDVMMSGAVIVLSSAAGVLALVDPHTQVLVGSMNIVGAGIGAMAGIFKFGERKRQHDFFEDEYEYVSNKIEAELTTMHTDPTYANADEFVKACRATMDRMDARAPNIPEWIEARHAIPNIVPDMYQHGNND
jgi:hypothetical protein